MDPEEQAKMDQDLAKLRDGLAGMIWALFEGLKEKGFTEEQAMALARAYVHGMAGGKYQG